jgi:hypothetical protein
MQVVGKRRSGNPELILQTADRQTVVAGADERAIDLEPGRIAERFELLCRLFDFHGNKHDPAHAHRQGVFPRLSKLIRFRRRACCQALLSHHFTCLYIEDDGVRRRMLEVEHVIERTGEFVIRTIAQSAKAPIVLDKTKD